MLFLPESPHWFLMKALLVCIQFLFLIKCKDTSLNGPTTYSCFISTQKNQVKGVAVLEQIYDVKIPIAESYCSIWKLLS